MNKPIKIPLKAQKVMEILTKEGFSIYLVGGAVRSALLNMPISDYDFTTNATPSELLEVYKDYPCLTYGIKHGTVTVIYEHENFEITTFRKECDYKDHRHPTTVAFTTDLKTDLSRRDFTINAMAYSPNEGLIDYFGGQDDLRQRIIRTVFDPYLRFEEDVLRILRAIRFQARLNFTIEEKTHKAMVEMAKYYPCLSKERVTKEFDEILKSPYTTRALTQNFDVLEEIFQTTFHQEVYAKTLDKFDFIKQFEIDQTAISFALFASLFNDPMHFLKQNFKLTSDTLKKIKEMYESLSLPIQTDYEIQTFFAKNTLCFKETLLFYLLQNDQFDIHTYQDLLKLHEVSIYSIKQLDINAKDLIELGIQGKAIKDTQMDLLEKIMQNKLPNKKQALLQYAKRLSQ